MSASVGNVFLNWVAPAMGCLMGNIMFVIPLVAVLRVRRQAALGFLNPLPFPVILVNCLNWIIYSLLIRSVFLFWANLPGMLLGLYFTTSVLPYCTPDQRRRVEAVAIILLGLELVVCGFVAFIVVNDGKLRKTIVGLAAYAPPTCIPTWNVILFAYYGAPLSTFMEVVRTRNAGTLYWPMCVANAINGFSWAAYGVVLDDLLIMIPNAAGCVLGLISIVLLLTFKSTDSGEMKKSASQAQILGGAVGDKPTSRQTSGELKVVVNPFVDTVL